MTFLARFFILLSLVVLPAVSFAVVQDVYEDGCVYHNDEDGPEGSDQSGWVCDGQGASDIVVVTGVHRSSFAELVYEDIVPFIDGVLAPFLYAIAFLVFVFGIVRFFFTGGAENREKGQQFALWGLIGFVVLFSLWGMVRLLLDFVFPA